MKKIISLCLSLLITFAMFAGCQAEDDGKIKIVTTVFPCYDWTREILGDRINDVDLTYLLNNGVDLHSYQPTSGDLIKIEKSDLFVFVGGESDGWVDNILKNDKNINALNTMDVLKNAVLEEELVEGMQSEEDDEDGEEETEYDEHIWLSFKNAATVCNEICERLCKIDPDNEDTYRKNTESYKHKLDGLNTRYTEAVASAQTKTLMFADRFPFRYLAADLGIKYYAAFSGCSSECDASFKTIQFLAERLCDENLPAVLILEGSDRKIADSVIKASKLDGVEVIEINSMQTATVGKNDKDQTYLSLAESNLKVLKKALKSGE